MSSVTYPNLEAMMAKKGMKPSDIATALGCNYDTAIRLIKGKTSIKVAQAVVIRDFVSPDSTIDYLFVER